MPNTPLHSLPYPSMLDTADVPRDIQALATTLDPLVGGGGAQLVTSLPASPTDGREVYYLADATAGIIWHLRYRAASASAYKWEYIGGTGLYSERLPDESSASAGSAAWVQVNASDPKVTVPLAGDYRAVQAATILPPSTGCTMAIGLTVGGVAPTTATHGAWETMVANQSGSVAQQRALSALAAATEVKQSYLQASAGAQVIWRRSASLLVTPIRVG